MLEVTAHGTLPLYYQWYYEGNVIATGMLTVPSAARSPSVDTSFTYSLNLTSNKEFSMPQKQECICQDNSTSWLTV